MNVSLDPDVEKFIDEQVRAGRFATPEELIQTAIARLRHVEPHDFDEPDDAGIAAIEEGLAQANRGEGRPWEEVREELRRKYLRK